MKIKIFILQIFLLLYLLFSCTSEQTFSNGNETSTLPQPMYDKALFDGMQIAVDQLNNGEILYYSHVLLENTEYVGICMVVSADFSTVLRVYIESKNVNGAVGDNGNVKIYKDELSQFQLNINAKIDGDELALTFGGGGKILLSGFSNKIIKGKLEYVHMFDDDLLIGKHIYVKIGESDFAFYKYGE